MRWGNAKPRQSPWAERNRKSEKAAAVDQTKVKRHKVGGYDPSGRFHEFAHRGTRAEAIELARELGLRGVQVT